MCVLSRFSTMAGYLRSRPDWSTFINCATSRSTEKSPYLVVSVQWESWAVSSVEAVSLGVTHGAAPTDGSFALVLQWLGMSAIAAVFFGGAVLSVRPFVIGYKQIRLATAYRQSSNHQTSIELKLLIPRHTIRYIYTMYNTYLFGFEFPLAAVSKIRYFRSLHWLKLKAKI